VTEQSLNRFGGDVLTVIVHLTIVDSC